MRIRITSSQQNSAACATCPSLWRCLFAGTSIADLTPLADLAALQSLDCSGAQVTDLTPLSGLVALRCNRYGISQRYTPVVSRA